LEIMWNKVIVL